MNFQLMATFENIVSISEMNFISYPKTLKMVNEELANQINNPTLQS